jgi:hypothetical protein
MSKHEKAHYLAGRGKAQHGTAGRGAVWLGKDT